MSKVHNIWTTKIVEYFLTDINIKQDLENSLKTYESEIFVSGDKFNILKDNKLFSEWVLSCAKDYCVDLYDTTKGLYIERGWLMNLEFGDSNEIHSHHPHHLSVVYYIDAQPNIHPELEVVDPRPPHIFNIVSRVNKHGQNASGFRSIKLKPESGKLIIMPGYLLHLVGTNLSQSPRSCVAMNINMNINLNK